MNEFINSRLSHRNQKDEKEALHTIMHTCTFNRSDSDRNTLRKQLGSSEASFYNSQEIDDKVINKIYEYTKKFD